MSDFLSSDLIPYQVALTAVLLVVGLNLIANLRMVEKATPSRINPAGLERVSVLVLARNEARNIRRCLESLLAQDYPLMEILVLDDGSTDETPEIVAEMARRDLRLRLIPGQPLPAGWMGKNFACHQLAQEARGVVALHRRRHRPPSPDHLLGSHRREGEPGRPGHSGPPRRHPYLWGAIAAAHYPLRRAGPVPAGAGGALWAFPC